MIRATIRGGLFLLMLACITLGVVSVGVAGSRLWKYGRGGKYEVRAEFVKIEKGRVHLKRERDGQVITVARESLSRYDQRWVERELERRRSGEEKPTGSKAKTPKTAAGTVPGQCDWPQWRGPNRDGKSRSTSLLQRWSVEGPPLLWTAKRLGKGNASLAVANGKVFTTGRRGTHEYLLCLEEKTGKQLWAATLGDGEPSQGTPVVDGDLVYVIGSKGDLLCAQVSNGREIWRKNLVEDFGGKTMSGQGFSESPLIDGNKLICTPGGPKTLMVALNKRTGDLIWATSFSGTHLKRGRGGAGYSSMVVTEAGGVRQYVQLVGRGVVGVNAKTGKLLWGYNKIANTTANTPTPVLYGKYVFCSTGYDTGAVLLKLTGDGTGKIHAKPIYFIPGNKFQHNRGGMIAHEKHLYCGMGSKRGELVCLNMATAKSVWKLPQRLGNGFVSIAFADGNLYCRYEDGTVALIEATPRAFVLKGSFQIPSCDQKGEAAPVVANGKLYIRNQDYLHCYNIQAK